MSKQLAKIVDDAEIDDGPSQLAPRELATVLPITIVLPTPGSDFDTWGDELNTALATLRDALNNFTKVTIGLGNVPNADATNRLNHTGSQPTSSITGLDEQIRDVIGTALTAGAGISIAVNDAGDTITITGSPTTVAVQPVKTADFAATAGNFYPIDASAASVQATLPASPADGAQVGFDVIGWAPGKTVTVAVGGAHTFEKTGGGTSFTLNAVGSRIVLQYEATNSVWYAVSSSSSTSSGGVAAGNDFSKCLWGTIFVGPAPIDAAFNDGISTPFPTVATELRLSSRLKPAGNNTTVGCFLYGPSTNWVLGTTPDYTVTFTAGVNVASTGPISKAMQALDRWAFRVTGAGSSPVGDVDAFIFHDPNASVPQRIAAPTIGTALVSGQPAGCALVPWTPPTLLAGQTPTTYLVTAHPSGVTKEAAYGATSVVVNGLPATSQTFSVHLSSAEAGAGLESAESNGVIPASSSTPTADRLTNAERQGQGWDSDGAGTVAYDSTFTPAGTPSPLTGSLKLTADSSLNPVQAVLHTAKTMAAGETGMDVSAIVRNRSGNTVTVQAWIVSLNSGGGFDTSVGFDTFDIPDDGNPHTIELPSVDATGASATGKVAFQLIPVDATDNVNISGIHWSPAA